MRWGTNFKELIFILGDVPPLNRIIEAKSNMRFLKHFHKLHLSIADDVL